MTWCRHCMEELEPGPLHLGKNLSGKMVRVCPKCHGFFKREKKWPPIYLRENHTPIKRSDPITLELLDQMTTEFERYRWASFYKGVLIRG